MRRATQRLITIIAVLGLVGLATSAPAFADDGIRGNGNSPGISKDDSGPQGTTGASAKGGKGESAATASKGTTGKKDPAKGTTNEPAVGGSSGGGSTDPGTTAAKKDAGSGTQGGGSAGGGKPEADMSGKSSGPAENSPPGNNGTIKVHDQGPQVHSDVEVRRNEPHVSCVFHLYGFHFDAGQSGSWRIVAWSPTGDRETQVASGSWTASAQGDWQSGAITLPQDGHYKLYFGTFNGHNKHKVFWVEGCAPSPTTQPSESPKPTKTPKPDKTPKPSATPSPTPSPSPTPPQGGSSGGPEKVTVCIELGNGQFKIIERNENAGEHPNQVDMALCDEQDDDVQGADKVWVCHITGSGWVKIHIARAGWDNGHSKHEGDVMAETEEGLPENCGAVLGEESPPPSSPPPTGGGDTGGGQTTVVTDRVCINNALMERTFVNGQLVSMSSMNLVCVLGIEMPPVNGPIAVVMPIIERLPGAVGQLPAVIQQIPGAVQGVITPALGQILGMLPSTSSIPHTDNMAAVGIAGLAVLAAGVLLLRKLRRLT